MTPDNVELELAAAAARLIVDEGLDHAAAKRRAVSQLRLPARTPLLDNQRIEVAVREHLAVFHADTQPAELRALRELAVMWMDRLASFQPHLTGAVWSGTATRLTDVWLQLFCEDPKAAEIELINQNLRFEVGRTQGFNGREVDVLSLTVPCRGLGEPVGVHLVLYDRDDVRGALRPDAWGRAPRGSVQAVRALLEAPDSPAGFDHRVGAERSA